MKSIFTIETEFKKDTPLVDVELVRRTIEMLSNVAFVGIIENLQTEEILHVHEFEPMREKGWKTCKCGLTVKDKEPKCNCTFNYGSHMPKCAITLWKLEQ